MVLAFKYYGNVSQCNLTHINCMNDIREIVTSLQPQNGAALQNKIDNRIHEGLKCDCKPGCNEVVLLYFSSKSAEVRAIDLLFFFYFSLFIEL